MIRISELLNTLKCKSLKSKMRIKWNIMRWKKSPKNLSQSLQAITNKIKTKDQIKCILLKRLK